jgi:hypothetical protein
MFIILITYHRPLLLDLFLASSIIFDFSFSIAFSILNVFDLYKSLSSTHTFSSLLGEVSPNPNPFFPENLGKATIDWSWREVELRDLYKSKTFKIENAIEKLKSKMMEDAKNKSNNNGR